MSDEKPKRPRASASGGERPMRRKAALSETTSRKAAPTESVIRKAAPAKSAGGARPPMRTAEGKPRFEKPEGDRKPAKKPEFKKPRKPLPPPVEKTSAFEGERVSKVMARAGACSRRDAETWIAEGRVAVNGRVLTSPAVNVREGDVITIDGKPMQEKERTRLFLFHKPAGLVTSARDPEGRETVFAFLDERHPDLPRVVSVGRLDINTEGLLLLTNDGGLARALELPATGWTRRYRVRVHGEVDQAALDGLREGVTVDDVRYAPIDAVLDRTQGANAWLTMGLTEGKNREIKRVLEHLMLDVARLIRVSYGPFQLGDLAEGAVEEVKLKTLREQLGKGLAELAGVDFASPLRTEATPAEAQETRQRLQSRSRKHVSVLRKERDETAHKGPRAKVERSATADRKGRAVTVERVASARPKPEPAATRNARRFEAIRRDGEEARTPRAPREGAVRHERSDARPARSRGEGGFARKERGEGRPPRAEGASEGRAFSPRPPRGEARPPRGEARPPRGEGRPPRGEGGSRYERSEARPARNRAEGGFEGKERGGRPDSKAPRSEGRAYAPRPPRGEGRPERSGARPPREGNFERGEGRALGPRPPRGEGRPPRGDARPPRGEGRPPRAEGASRYQRSDARPPREGASERPPRKFEGARKPGGAGKPGRFGKPGGAGKPGGFGKPRGPGGPRKPGGGGAPRNPR